MRKDPHLKPVKRVELSPKHVRLRAVLAAVLLLTGAGLIARAVWGWIYVEAGWTEIEASQAEDVSCAGDFVLLYDLGADSAAMAEKKALTRLYSEACVTAYRLFTGDAEYEDVVNIRTINAHPNEELTVDPALYAALSEIEESGSRYPYLAPACRYYDNLFYVTDDSGLYDYDPRRNGELAEEFGKIAAYARDPDAVTLRLLGDNRVCLQVSEAYLSWADAHGYTDFIGFSWMENAFRADYLAQVLTGSGWTRGTLSAFDGFVVNLGGSGEESFSFTVFDREGETVRTAASMNYTGALSLVFLRDYPLYDLDARHYYEEADGTIRTAYLSLEDGLDRTAAHDLVVYTRDGGCGAAVLAAAELWTGEELDEAALKALEEKGIYSVLTEDGRITCGDENVRFSDVNASYTAVTP